jgi:hypothetical protein
MVRRKTTRKDGSGVGETTTLTDDNPFRRKRRMVRRSFGLFRDRKEHPSDGREQPSPEREEHRKRGIRRSSPAALELTNDLKKESSDTDSSHKPQSEDEQITEAMLRTQVMTVRHGNGIEADSNEEAIVNAEAAAVNVLAAPPSPKFFTSATAILQHSYLELLCGPVDAVDESLYQKKRHLPDDPTIQESIECVFASQLEEGLPCMLLDDDDDDEDGAIEGDGDLLAPSVLQQSLLKSRSFSKLHMQRSPKPRKRKVQNRLVHVQTMDPTKLDEVQSANDLERFSPGSVHCACCQQSRPLLDPERWPQRPLLLRPTPGSGTRIKGIRFSGSSDYIWEARKSTLTWPSSLRARWGKDESPEDSSNPLDIMCSECMVLPINNGNEPPNEVLVTDFATDLFEGTLLLRLRHTEGTTPSPYDDTKGYFAGMNRRYQVVVQGRFKREIPLTQCVAGTQLERKCGKLPANWIIKSAIKVVGFFAPQLEAKLDGDRPTSLSPLGSTPQCIRVENKSSFCAIDGAHQEPTEASATLLGQASNGGSNMQRARFRKKAFDRLFSQSSPLPKTDTSKVYTFEFLQHLFNFQEFSIELGSMLGSIQLKEILDGQPMQLMASHGSSRLWSFDIWHEELVDDARIHDQLKKY